MTNDKGQQNDGHEVQANPKRVKGQRCLKTNGGKLQSKNTEKSVWSEVSRTNHLPGRQWHVGELMNKVGCDRVDPETPEEWVQPLTIHNPHVHVVSVRVVSPENNDDNNKRLPNGIDDRLMLQENKEDLRREGVAW